MNTTNVIARRKATLDTPTDLTPNATKNISGALNIRLADAETAILATKTAAMANVRGIAMEAAAAIVTRLTGVAIPEPAVATAVDAVLKR